MQTLRLADGRAMAYETYGAPGGRAALYCHGFPTSHHEARLVEDEARRRGVWVLAPDRPGYGGSSPLDMAALADWAADVEQLLEHLEAGPVAVIGVSGGGPYALALAARLPDRVAAVGLAGPLGPVAERPLMRVMRPIARLGFLLARRAPRTLAAIFAAARGALARRPDLLGRGLAVAAPPADRTVLARADVQAVLVAGVLDALADGGHAAAAELARYARPWGFELCQVRCPVVLWHGLEDTVVPVLHGRRLAIDLERVETRYLPGEGHYSVPVSRSAEIMDTLGTCLAAVAAGTASGDTD